MLDQDEFETLVDNLILEAWHFHIPTEESEYKNLIVEEWKRLKLILDNIEYDLRQY